ncbi:polysaccharide deacetylase family protein [Reichenbachiella versicolor]|uniref:hypothetical protein n=1 Tax=Reichenbachiella versicolor TaxID=1821036 RepID=UPI000D6E71B6|nr:hypothetical protein [Reichenbachiella versicolor]
MKTAFLSLIFDYTPVLSTFSIFDIGSDKHYVDWEQTQSSFNREYFSEFKRYLEEMLHESQDKDTPISVYFSGFFIKLLEKADEKMIHEIKIAVNNRKLELLGGTINNSLSSLYSQDQFTEEVKAHKSVLKKVFDYKPVSFYNTESIYCNTLADLIKSLGFKRTFAGAISWYMGSNKKDRVFIPKNIQSFNILILDKDNSLFDNPDQKAHFLLFDIKRLREHKGVSRVLLATRTKAKIKSLTDSGKLNSKKLYYIKTPTMGSLNGKTFSSFNGQAMQTNTLDMYYNISEQAGVISDSQFLDLGAASLYLNLGKKDDSTAFDKYSNMMNILNDADLKA